MNLIMYIAAFTTCCSKYCYAFTTCKERLKQIVFCFVLYFLPERPQIGDENVVSGVMSCVIFALINKVKHM